MDSISLKPLPTAYLLSTILSHPLLHISQKRNAISETYLVFPEQRSELKPFSRAHILLKGLTKMQKQT